MGVAGFSESLGLHTIYVFVSEGTLASIPRWAITLTTRGYHTRLLSQIPYLYDNKGIKYICHRISLSAATKIP